jgi:DNA-directed RNA polymerase subunit RPC12/RpoP
MATINGMEAKRVTEIYCAACGELVQIPVEDVKLYIRCAYCGSADINEA